MSSLRCKLFDTPNTYWNHDWSTWTPSSLDSTLENFMQRVLKINASAKSLVERLCDFKIYANSVLSSVGYAHPTWQSSRPRTMAFSCTTAGPYNAIPCNLLEVGSVCGLGPDLVVVFTPSALRLAIELLHARPRIVKALTKSKRLVGTIVLLFSLFLLSGRKSSFHPPWPVALRIISILFVAWTVMANLMKSRRIKSRKLQLDFLLTNSMKKTLLRLISLRASKVFGPISRYRVADILLHMKLVTRASRPGSTVGSFVTGFAQLKDFVLKNLTTRVVLDAQMNLTLSHITTSVPSRTTYLSPSGDMLLHFHKETIFCMACSLCVNVKPSIWDCGDGLS